MRGLLTHWGCRVTTASSPAQAIEHIEKGKSKPELLILDYRLHGNVTGIEVAKQLQSSLTNTHQY